MLQKRGHWLQHWLRGFFGGAYDNAVCRRGDVDDTDDMDDIDDMDDGENIMRPSMTKAGVRKGGTGELTVAQCRRIAYL